MYPAGVRGKASQDSRQGWLPKRARTSRFRPRGHVRNPYMGSWEPHSTIWMPFSPFVMKDKGMSEDGDPSAGGGERDPERIVFDETAGVAAMEPVRSRFSVEPAGGSRGGRA